MLDQYLPYILIVAGAIFLLRSLRLWLSTKQLHKYLENNPKIKPLTNKLGIEKTEKLAKTYFLPIGCFMAVMILWSGFLRLEHQAKSSNEQIEKVSTSQENG